MYVYYFSVLNAMNKYSGGVANYRAPEGKTIKIPYKGSLLTIIQNILGGLRSCMTYIGAKKLKDIPKCTTFIRVNNQYNTIYNNHTI
jgi:GMP reductase